MEAPDNVTAVAAPPVGALIVREAPFVVMAPLSITDRPAVRLTPSPEPLDVMALDAGTTRSEVDPVVCSVRLVALMEPTERVSASWKVKDPSVPEPEIPPTSFGPVRSTVPAPVTLRALATITPEPEKIAPDVTSTAAVPLPTFHDPERVKVPPLRSVAPV